MSQILVSVKDGYGTYTAKFGKHRASCTSGERQAVERLAEKIFGDKPATVAFQERLGQSESEWLISVEDAS